MASGKTLLRMDQQLHRSLQKVAAQKSLSMNELCCLRLQWPSALEQLALPVGEMLVAAGNVAQELFGEHLRGVLLFGSWARGTARETSDIDLLFVLSSKVAIKRHIYREWDKKTSEWSTKVEPHFVHLPTDQKNISSLWAEVALDGVVLLDPSGQIHQYLQQTRRKIAEGDLVAKQVHGHLYWVHGSGGRKSA